MFCKTCGAANDDQARFCYQCGTDPTKRRWFSSSPTPAIQKQNLKKRKYRGNSNDFQTFIKKAPLFVGIALIIVTIVFLVDSKQKSEEPTAIREEKSGNLTVELKVKEIASKFVCTCGSCGEESLEVCSCNRAIQERQVIRDYLTDGQSPDQIVTTINSSYGGLKTQGSNNSLGSINQLAGRIDLSATSKNSLPRSSDSSSEDEIATIADFNEILSHFQCPCGKCETDELKDCNCSHPKGATEVKAFLKKKINEGRFTVKQLIDEIDATFGGKKTEI